MEPIGYSGQRHLVIDRLGSHWGCISLAVRPWIWSRVRFLSLGGRVKPLPSVGGTEWDSLVQMSLAIIMVPAVVQLGKTQQQLIQNSNKEKNEGP